ncbi:hypothetical protein C8R44DRAFT_888045 [Mycena epipterygia]|nr:hypothetical protein C8R44DRAFT_888045 [Mycena epipterygia]
MLAGEGAFCPVVLINHTFPAVHNGHPSYPPPPSLIFSPSSFYLQQPPLQPPPPPSSEQTNGRPSLRPPFPPEADADAGASIHDLLPHRRVFAGPLLRAFAPPARSTYPSCSTRTDSLIRPSPSCTQSSPSSTARRMCLLRVMPLPSPIGAASGAAGGSRFVLLPPHASSFSILRFHVCSASPGAYPPQVVSRPPPLSRLPHRPLHGASLLATSSYTAWLRAFSSARTPSHPIHPHPIASSTLRHVASCPFRVVPPLLPAPVPALLILLRPPTSHHVLPRVVSLPPTLRYIASSFQCFPTLFFPVPVLFTCLLHPTSLPLCARPRSPSARSARFAPAHSTPHPCLLHVPSIILPPSPRIPLLLPVLLSAPLLYLMLTHALTLVPAAILLQAGMIKNKLLKLTGESIKIAQDAVAGMETSILEADLANEQ